jgi:hypothetical protein
MFIGLDFWRNLTDLPLDFCRPVYLVDGWKVHLVMKGKKMTTIYDIRN